MPKKAKPGPSQQNPWTRVGQRWGEFTPSESAELAFRYAPERARVTDQRGWNPDEILSHPNREDAEREMNALQADMGLGKYALKKSWAGDGELDADVVGDYRHRLGSIRQVPDADGAMGTMAHELAHAADRIKEDYNSPKSWGGGLYKMNQHHKFYEDFSSDFANQLQAQRRIEYGEPVPKEVMARMPWLKDVKPASSNRLASPWSKMLEPEWVTNARFEGNRLDQDIEDARKHERKKRGD